jgi:hypothetical protein
MKQLWVRGAVGMAMALSLVSGASAGLSVSFQLFRGPTTPPDCLIWDIGGPGAASAPSGGSGSGTSLGELLIAVEPTEFLSPDGDLLCTIETDGNQAMLRDADSGDVLLTQWGHYVFEGFADLSPPSAKVKATRKYEFAKEQVFLGDKSDGEVLVTASEHIHNTSPQVKLLVAALIEGVCGGTGIPEDEYDHMW